MKNLFRDIVILLGFASFTAGITLQWGFKSAMIVSGSLLMISGLLMRVKR